MSCASPSAGRVIINSVHDPVSFLEEWCSSCTIFRHSSLPHPLDDFIILLESDQLSPIHSCVLRCIRYCKWLMPDHISSLGPCRYSTNHGCHIRAIWVPSTRDASHNKITYDLRYAQRLHFSRQIRCLDLSILTIKQHFPVSWSSSTSPRRTMTPSKPVSLNTSTVLSPVRPLTIGKFSSLADPLTPQAPQSTMTGALFPLANCSNPSWTSALTHIWCPLFPHPLLMLILGFP